MIFVVYFLSKVLALWQWEEISPQVMDLYSEFERETVSKLVETVLEAFVEPPILTLDSNQQNFRNLFAIGYKENFVKFI